MPFLRESSLAPDLEQEYPTQSRVPKVRHKVVPMNRKVEIPKRVNP
jgi:hypothetical protein